MAESGSKDRGTGILMRRTKVSRDTCRHQQEAAPVHYHAITTTINHDKQHDPFEGMWMYPEFMDIIALVAALVLATAMASFLAFTTEEIEPANERYLTYKGGDSIWGVYPVSTGLSMFAIMSTAFSSISLILSVGVRMMLTYAANMESHSRQRAFLLNWANPTSVVIVILWTLGLGFCAVSVYFVGWIAFPEEVAHGAVQLGFGVTFIISICILCWLSIYIVVQTIYLGKDDGKKIVETPAPRAGNHASTSGTQDQTANSVPVVHSIPLPGSMNFQQQSTSPCDQATQRNRTCTSSID